ncbi:DNA base-flipping protein [Diplonema papillatum]|nr:DNA base-flipping protein [Diplonema papillatum]
MRQPKPKVVLTEKAKAVHRALAKVKKGTVISYGNLGNLAGLSNAGRLVGNTMRRLPPNSRLPWHRVVNSKGQIAFPPDTKAYKAQLSRFKAECVVLENNRVDASRMISA